MLSRKLFLALTGGALAAPAISWGAPTLPDVPVALDHILLGCNDLDRGIAFVERNTSVRAAFGGVHPGRGTRNALLSLGEKHYLEIIAPDPTQMMPDVASRTGSLHPVLSQVRALKTPRLIGWAAHPGDLEQFASRLRDAGLAFDGPNPGSRKRPDGRLLQWKTLNLRDDHHGLLPFFIEWAAGTAHPSVDAPSGCKIARFELAAPNDAELNHLCALLNLEVPIAQADKPQIRAHVSGPSGQVLQLTS